MTTKPAAANAATSTAAARTESASAPVTAAATAAAASATAATAATASGEASATRSAATDASGGSIRKARIDDAAAILRLEDQFPTDRMSLRSVRRFLRVPSAQVWVAEREGAVVGALIWLSRSNSRAARIYSVVIAPEARGLGLAQQLVTAMETEARAFGRETATLEVRADNAAARALYAKLGYELRAELPGYYEDGADGLRLEKKL